MTIGRRARPACTAAAWVALVACAACDAERALPPAPSAARAGAEQSAEDRLRAHLATIPGVTAASVVVGFPDDDPFERSSRKRRPTRTALLLTTARDSDARLVRDAARDAALALLGPDVDVAVEVAPPPAAPATVSVGPFRVAPSSRPWLIATLAGALVIIAGLSACLVWLLLRRRP